MTASRGNAIGVLNPGMANGLMPRLSVVMRTWGQRNLLGVVEHEILVLLLCLYRILLEGDLVERGC